MNIQGELEVAALKERARFFSCTWKYKTMSIIQVIKYLGMIFCTSTL